MKVPDDDVDINEDGPPEHLSYITPSTEENRSQSLAEGSEPLSIPGRLERQC